MADQQRGAFQGRVSFWGVRTQSGPRPPGSCYPLYLVLCPRLLFLLPGLNKGAAQRPEEWQFQNGYRCNLRAPWQPVGFPQGKGISVPVSQVKPHPYNRATQVLLEKPWVRLPGPMRGIGSGVGDHQTAGPTPRPGPNLPLPHPVPPSPLHASSPLHLLLAGSAGALAGHLPGADAQP